MPRGGGIRRFREWVGGQRYWSVTSLESLIMSNFQSPFLNNSPDSPSPRLLWKLLVCTEVCSLCYGDPRVLRELLRLLG